MRVSLASHRCRVVADEGERFEERSISKRKHVGLTWRALEVPRLQLSGVLGMKKTHNESLVLTVDQAADLLQCSKDQIYELIRRTGFGFALNI